MVVDDAPDHRKPQTITLLTLRRVEGLEDLRQLVLGNAAAVVAHARLHVLPLAGGVDRLPALPIAPLARAAFHHSAGRDLERIDGGPAVRTGPAGAEQGNGALGASELHLLVRVQDDSVVMPAGAVDRVEVDETLVAVGARLDPDRGLAIDADLVVHQVVPLRT